MKTLPRSESTLQLARRLDWRFLLPEPNLRRVAYFGARQSALALALRRFSEELIVFESSRQDFDHGTQARFDLAVLQSPSFAQLERAHALLASPGYLYAEVQHAWEWRSARGRNLPDLAAWQAGLARLGFVEIKAHWHRPTFERAVQIIPMHDDRAMNFVFNRRDDDLTTRLKFAAGRALIKRAWLARWLQCVSLVARKQ
jgi:hypothetical protein